MGRLIGNVAGRFFKLNLRIAFRDKRKKQDELEDKLKEADKLLAIAGLLPGAKPYPDGTSVIDVAFFNEFGTITIPQRSFIRSTAAENSSRIANKTEKELGTMVDCRITPKIALGRVADLIAKLIVRKINSNVPPPNAIATLDRKTGQKTLVDTGHMRSQVSGAVVRK